MSNIATESGLRNHRTEFVREEKTAEGDPVTPENPNFQLYSDRVRNYEWSPSPGIEANRGLGDYDPDDHDKGPVEHQLTVVYDMQQWFVDADTNPLDASADGILRTADGTLPNTHTFVDREEKGRIAASNTNEGDTARGSRSYTVGRGGVIDEVAITGDPGDQQPIAIELTYEYERMRSIKLDQPNAPTALEVVSTVDGDTGEVTVEDEGGATSTTVSLNGTTVVPVGDSTIEYGDVDAFELSAPQEGDVILQESGGGPELGRLKGYSSYDDVDKDGDIGVPALGSGSRATEIGTAYEKFIGDTIQREAAPFAMDINSFSFTISNNTDRTVREDTFAQRIHIGNRDISIEGTVVGETESHGALVESLTNHPAPIAWEFSSGTLTGEDSRLTEPGSRAPESGEPAMSLDNTFSAEGLTIA